MTHKKTSTFSKNKHSNIYRLYRPQRNISIPSQTFRETITSRSFWRIKPLIKLSK